MSREQQSDGFCRKNFSYYPYQGFTADFSAKQHRFNKTNLQEDGLIYRNSLKRRVALHGEKKAYVASLRIFKHVM